MTSYEHKVKNIYLGSPYEEGTPIIPGDYTLLRGPCDEGFHVPPSYERQAIIDAGMPSNIREIFHIPLSAGRNGNSGSWTDWSTNNFYMFWCSDISFKKYAKMFRNGSVESQALGCGLTIRAFRNTPIIPDETRTETVTGKVWYNPDLGLISVLVGSDKYVTLQDKNVGATVVYNYGDKLTNNNRGKYFQRGNNYGFTWNSSGDTSSTQVDVSNYGPSNPYSSSTFIIGGKWALIENDNLRGYTDFNS